MPGSGRKCHRPGARDKKRCSALSARLISNISPPNQGLGALPPARCCTSLPKPARSSTCAAKPHRGMKRAAVHPLPIRGAPPSGICFRPAIAPAKLCARDEMSVSGGRGVADTYAEALNDALPAEGTGGNANCGCAGKRHWAWVGWPRVADCRSLAAGRGGLRGRRRPRACPT